MPRDGASYLKSLKDGRKIILKGKRVEDVITDPAFRNSIATYVSMYDYQCRPENVERMTFVSPTSGERVNRCWQLPTNYHELVERREAIEEWAEIHYGFMGRSPDHVASTLTGMYQGLNFFEEYDKDRAAAFRDYFHYVRDNDLFLTYVIINPPEDRSKQLGERESNNVRVVDEDAEGITVEGCKMLGTSSVMADEVLVSCLQPLQPGEEDYALTFCVPMDHKGLKILSRKSYEGAAHSVFDNPLSSRFDENDAVIHFDQSKIPWDRVFVYRDIDMARQTVPRHARPHPAELPGADAPGGEDALPGRPRPQDRGSDRHGPDAGRARHPRPPGGPGGLGQGLRARHGGGRRATRRTLSCPTATWSTRHRS